MKQHLIFTKNNNLSQGSQKEQIFEKHKYSEKIINSYSNKWKYGKFEKKNIIVCKKNKSKEIQKFGNKKFKQLSFNYNQKFNMQPSEFVLTTQVYTQEFKEMPQRWLITSIYCLLTIFNGIASKNVPPIATKLQQIYSVSSIYINAVPMAYLLIYAIVNLPANYLIDSHGIRLGLLIGSLFFIIGCAIQLLINYSFIFLIIGSILVAISQPFICNCPAKIATFWFKSQNRPLVTAALSLLSIIGSGIGILLPTLFIGQSSVGDKAKQQLFNLLITEFSLAAFTFLLVVLFMKSKPEIMPSLGSQIQKSPFIESIKLLWRNLNFRLLFIGFLLFNGPLITLVSLMNFIFKPFHFQDVQISEFGISIILCGIAGSVMFSVIVARTLKYNLIKKLLTGVSILVVILVVIVLKFYLNFQLIITLLSVAGFFIMPVTPLSFDFGCELTFPVGEAQVTGMLISSGSLISFILIIAIELSIGFGTQQQSYTIFILFLTIMFFGVIFYWLVQNDLKRRIREDSKNSNQVATLPTINVPIGLQSIQSSDVKNSGINVRSIQSQQLLQQQQQQKQVKVQIQAL